MGTSVNDRSDDAGDQILKKSASAPGMVTVPIHCVLAPGDQAGGEAGVGSVGEVAAWHWGAMLCSQMQGRGGASADQW